jgi:ubiquinone/menaquinone biosynthesis C-methylase UbiE
MPIARRLSANRDTTIENNNMATTIETGFSDVDASCDAGDLVDYLGLAAKHLAEHRRGAYGMLRLRPGAAVLDVGCGAGEVCVELAALVAPSGRVVGIDPSDAMLAAARRTADAAALPIELHVASAYALPFPDDTFDAVRAERVFQHLDDPDAALREMFRVMRPGGRVMVIDADHGQHGMALDHSDQRRVFEASLRVLTRMIANPHAGTRLRPMFARAGATEIELHTSAHEFAYPDFVRLFFLDERLKGAVEAGDITREEAADFVAALEDRHRSGTFFANVIGYSVVGTKVSPRAGTAREVSDAGERGT